MEWMEASDGGNSWEAPTELTYQDKSEEDRRVDKIVKKVFKDLQRPAAPHNIWWDQ